MMFRSHKKIMILILVIMNKLSEDFTNAIPNSKLAYHRGATSKRNVPNSAPKSYWSILKLFVNSKNRLTFWEKQTCLMNSLLSNVMQLKMTALSQII